MTDDEWQFDKHEVVENGDGECPECISDEERSDLLQSAARNAEL